MYELNFEILLKSHKFILYGLFITVFISVISSFLAFLIGSFLSYARTYGSKMLKIPSSFLVEFIRNTPLLIQIFIFYKGLPSLGVSFSGLTCGILSLSLYTGVYISEVIRSGINSVAKEQFLAARSLGLSRIQAYSKIIYPQAVRNVIPTLSGQFINLVKNSSLVSFIAVTDIFYVIYKGSTDEFRVYEYFLLGIVIYMGLTGLISLVFNGLNEKYKIKGKVQQI